jgi:hypothetical protein
MKCTELALNVHKCFMNNKYSYEKNTHSKFLFILFNEETQWGWMKNVDNVKCQVRGFNTFTFSASLRRDTDVGAP